MKLKLLHKLLIALFTCTALVLVLLTVITRAQVGQGFEVFLQQQELSQLELLVPELEAWYRARGSWADMAADSWQFHSIMSSTLQAGRVNNDARGGGRRPPPRGGPGGGPEGRREGPPGGPPAGGRPPQRGSPYMHERVYLLDADNRAVVGWPREDVAHDEKLAIRSGGQTVGWLGVTPEKTTRLPEEATFMRGLRNNLLLGLGGGLLVAAVLAGFMARHLSRPVSAVAGGIRALAAGEYDAHVDTRGSDEISQLGGDVNTLAAALKDSQASRKRWMSDMAHELRTPLAIIGGELEAMSDGVRPLDKTQLASVQSEVKQLGRLVDDLHHLALTDSGALAYTMQPLDLDELLQLEVDSFTGRAQAKGLKLAYRGPGQGVQVNGDAQRLRQLLHNLLDNSVAYTDAGGTITIGLEASSREARITVNDTAPGASLEQCERLFERLYRVEGSRNRRSGGSGLGLSICRNIVQAHGGSISARPGPDGGLLIITSLPIRS